MKILALMTCSDQLSYLPYSTEQMKHHGIELLVVDYFSSDESYTWLKRHKIKAIQIDPLLKSENLLNVLPKKILEGIQPDWIIESCANEFLITPHSTIREIIGQCHLKGYHQVKCREFIFHPTGEESLDKNPKQAFFYYREKIKEDEPAKIKKFGAPNDAPACLIEAFFLHYLHEASTFDKGELQDIRNFEPLSKFI